MVAEAATILKPTFISREDLSALIEEARSRGSAPWRKEEKRMISLIPRARETLAPLGVETMDIRRLVNHSIRHAWRNLK